MGLIHLEGMEFYAYHGHYREEQVAGNHFTVDLILETDMDTPAATDDLNDATDYQTAYTIVKREMEVKSRLLEHVAGRILDALHSELKGIRKATVTVSKMNPSLGGKICCVSVTMSR